MWDLDDHSFIEFRAVFKDTDGNTTSEVYRRLYDGDTEYLPNILREFHHFLYGLTFTYVDEVIAKSDKGCHSSDDV